MIIATIATAAILPSLVSGSLNSVMAQGQNMTAGNMTAGNMTAGNMTAGNMTETESLTTAGETGCPFCLP
ncbi:MAG: hypothetical protein H0X50_11650 [Nitrosopumilus sp.]|nr:hypothetical protein [Nitrosopumilus sp.]